jgi:hypothetical protein
MAALTSSLQILAEGSDVLSTFQGDIRGFLDNVSVIAHDRDSAVYADLTPAPAITELQSSFKGWHLSRKCSTSVQRILATFNSLHEDLDITLRELNRLSNASVAIMRPGPIIATATDYQDARPNVATNLHLPSFFNDDIELASLEMKNLGLDVAREAAATSAAVKRLHEHAEAAASSYIALRQQAAMKVIRTSDPHISIIIFNQQFLYNCCNLGM